MIDAATLGRIRATAERTMQDTCTVQRDVDTRTSSGGWTTTSTTVATTVCGVRVVSGGPEQAIADRLGWTIAYLVRVPVGTDVTPKDRVIVNGTRTFEVGTVLEAGTLATVRTLVCQEVSP